MALEFLGCMDGRTDGQKQFHQKPKIKRASLIDELGQIT
jgi:hypothetical protein